MVFTHGLARLPALGLPARPPALHARSWRGIRVGIRLAARARASGRRVRRIETLALIVGAGSAGIQLLRGDRAAASGCASASSASSTTTRAKIGLRVCGTPVLGRIDDLPALVAAHDVGEVLIAHPVGAGRACSGASSSTARRRSVRHRVLPTLGELVDGPRHVHADARGEGRRPAGARAGAARPAARARRCVAGKTVLVTGAAGSIGSELCRQVAALRPGALVLYDRHENGMFVLEMELRARFPEVALVPVLGDVLLERPAASASSPPTGPSSCSTPPPTSTCRSPS